MPEYLHPGVFVEEVSSGVRPIEGVGTSTAGFVGVTSKGVPNKATFITTWTDFVRKFGYLTEDSFLPYAVAQFFGNGGKRCYIVRALNVISSVAASLQLADRETSGPARKTLQINANGAGAWGNGLLVTVQNGTNDPIGEFKLVIAQDTPDNIVELFDNLSMDPGSQDYVETSINNVSDFITVKNLEALEVSAPAQATTAAALAPANAVAGIAAGNTIAITIQDGTQKQATLAATPSLANLVTQLSNTFAPLNISVSLDPSNNLLLTSNAPGYDQYFTVTTNAAALAMVNNFVQGRGPAIPALLKSTQAEPFNIPAATTLTVTVHSDALPAIALTPNATAKASDVVSDLMNGFANNNANGVVRAYAENGRVVIATVNTGTADTALATSNLAIFAFASPSGTPNSSAGMGRNEAAFIQSAQGPFVIPDGSNLTITVNNGSLGAASATLVPLKPINNPAQATSQEIAAAINAVAAGFTATVQDNRVIVTQSRKGPVYTIQVTDGINSPNVRLKFKAAPSPGYADGDASSPYFRPASNFDVSGVNQPWVLVGGSNGGSVTNSDLIGSSDLKSGLHALDDVTDVNFIAIPGWSDPGLISQAVGYCTIRRDCFFIADSPAKLSKDAPATDPAHVADFLSNRITTKTSYGALYYPWLLINDDVGAGKNPTRFVAPSGFIAGLYARIDNTRGVWKAPAGTEASVIGPIDLEYKVTDSEQDILNPIGVNCIRQFPASGIVVWGARTLGTLSDPEWRYVPVRRYAIYLEQSILRGTQWAVFEPNDERLWASLKANIDDFMMGEFRKGALAGTTPKEAFSVKCDADLNPPSEVNAGRVNMEVKFAPLKPAEFVIIRISQKALQPAS